MKQRSINNIRMPYNPTYVTIEVPDNFPPLEIPQENPLTEEGILPYINHPVAQSGANINSANSLTIPKHRGLMLRRGQALFVATSGATALTNAFYCNVQGGFY